MNAELLSVLGAVLSFLGAGLTMGAAAWLLVGFKPKDPRFTLDTQSMYTPDEVELEQEGGIWNQNLVNLLTEQRKVARLAFVGASLAVTGGALQVLGLFLAG